MNTPPPKYDRKEIGSATVRIPSGTGMPDPMDVAIDPYAPTKVAKHVFIKGFQAWPQKGGPYPAVLILHEWWGLNSHFQDLAYRVAQYGYVALAVDQYSRIGGPVTGDPELAAQLMGNVKTADLLHDLNDAAEYLNFQDYVKKNRIVPIEKLSTLRCPVLYHQAEKDESVTQQEVDHLVSALTANKVTCEVHKYPGTTHSFLNDTRPDVYKAEAAAEAWARTLAFLDKYILADHPGIRPLPDSQRVR
ncbi:MAG: dienelactone hydrolase family protein [Nitrospirae bacterium]|nr:MAG: dienelactone hydrolase family protein [Nitrospirota bacterium]